MAKVAAGVPQIKNSHGSLSITFTPKGDKRKYLSLGLPESVRNRQYAEMVCKIIQNDILAGHFDRTLEKYKKHSNSKTPEPESDDTISENGLRLKQGLKTQKKRVFPCGDGMKKFLASINCGEGDRSGLIFNSPQGKFVDVQNLSVREFKPALKALGIKERNIYQTRHSYITFCIASGMPINDVAELVGNSPEIIYKHYLDGNKDLVAPDF